MKFIGFITAFVLLHSPLVFAEPSDLRNWIKTNSISVRDLKAPLTFEEEKTLDLALEGKRVVFLGEAAHWVHEKYDYRLRFLRYLVSKGFHHVGMEMGFSDGDRVDAFLSSGNISDLNRVALYGYANPYLRNRTVEGSCPLNAHPHHDFAKLFKQEEVWFYSQLRETGKELLPPKKRIHHFGFDIDARPGGAYEDITSVLRPFETKAPVEAFLKTFAPVPNESLSEEIFRLEQALASFSTHEISRIFSEHRLAWLRLSLRTLIESLRFQLVFQSRPCDQSEIHSWTQRLLKAMAEREKIMFELIKQKLSDLGPNAKIVLMGHNFHLSKEPQALWFAGTSVPEPHAPVMWPSIGEFVKSTLGVPVYSIWMLHRQGFQSNIDCPLIECAVETGPKYLGEMFSGFGSWFTLPMANPPSLLNQRLDFAVNGGTHSGNITRNADLIFFVDTVSGLRSR